MLTTASIVVVLLSALGVRAEKLPERRYGIADGLPSDLATCTRKDSHGFLWFCTPEGLSRFDGYAFTNYGVEQGLPDRVVTDFLETKHGEYWVGTLRGVALFNPKPGRNAPMFTPYGAKDTQAIHALIEDVHGTVWIAASSLFQLVPSKGAWSFQGADIDLPYGSIPELFLSDRGGNLWIAIYGASGCQLWRRKLDGKTGVFNDPFCRANRITSLTEDRRGRIWVGTFHGLGLMAHDPRPGGRIIEHVYVYWHRPTEDVDTINETSDGRLLFGAAGLQEILTDATGQIHFRTVDPKGHGFALEDGAGNLWLGNRKTERNGFATFGLEDGIKTNDIRSIFESADGALYVVTGIHNRYIHRLDGKHFTAVSPKVPGRSADWDWGGWGWGQIHLQDHEGEWWFATGYGVLHYPKVKRLEDLAYTPPKAISSLAHDIFRLYEDSRGDIWIGSWSKFGSGRWQRSSGRFQNLIPSEPTAFREDRAGNLWIAYWAGGLLRYRAGRTEWVLPHDGATTGSIFSLFLDHVGRMWAATTRSGLLRFDHPDAEHPTFRTYSIKEGLSSNDVRAITEDHFGRIYFWTGRGVDRLNPETGAIRHYTTADGLTSAGGDNNVAFCDHQGRIWFGLNGLSRLDPKPDDSPQPPPVRITKMRIRGVDYPVSELGETDLSGLELQPNENQIQIEFSSLDFAAGDVVKYQYKLEGAENDWSTPSDLRTVNYPRLPSGRYRFLVRAVNADGLMSTAPAVVNMRLLPPLWMRWWFLALATLLVSCAVFLAYNYRVRQLLELERVRTRIATDLHDDIGSSLTQIAIISEVARKQSEDSPAAGPLEHIADLSRELVDSMSDIVWAINPKRDQLGDLTQRMRRFASVVLEAADIEIDFRAPQEWADTALSADVRREVFLIFKESVNNIVRHADCRHASVIVDLSRGNLHVQLRDDGLGFSVEESDGHGHGLANMRTRAGRLGGKLDVFSVPGQGTTVSLTVPVGRASSVRRFAS